MKSIKFCIMLAALCCMVPAMAQKNFGSAKYTAMCSYYGETITGDIVAYKAGAEVQETVTKIMSAIGLKPNFELRIANVPNAAAVVIKSKRYILYNPDFMKKINNASGTNWAAISILAHEIGHHLNGHTLDNVGSRPGTELEADEFSGFVLRRMGATLPNAQAVMSIIASLKGSATHPAKNDRLTYIATGWNNAAPLNEKIKAENTKTDTRIAAAKTADKEKRYIASSNTVTAERKANLHDKPVIRAVNKPVDVRSKRINESINSSNVISIAYFDDNPGGHYYLTKRGNLVQVEKDKVYQVAKMYKSDKSGYNLMFADNSANKIYVANGGVLLNSKGKRIGYIKAR